MNETNVVDTFYCIDLDRTIFDTIGASTILIAIVNEHHPELALHIREQIDEYNRTGASFAIRDVIVEQVGEEAALGIEERFIERGARGDLLLPDAQALLVATDEPSVRARGILTYGSIPGQTMKLRAGGLIEVPHIITQEREKGALIASWKRGDIYQLPVEYGSLLARSVVLVDDRLFSFEGLPEDTKGYWITEHVSVLDEAPVLPNVRPVSSLAEVLIAEGIDKT